MQRKARRVETIASPHHLVYSERGRNRHKPGIYICECGLIFKAILKLESHLSEMREAGEILDGRTKASRNSMSPSND